MSKLHHVSPLKTMAGRKPFIPSSSSESYRQEGMKSGLLRILPILLITFQTPSVFAGEMKCTWTELGGKKSAPLIRNGSEYSKGDTSSKVVLTSTGSRSIISYYQYIMKNPQHYILYQMDCDRVESCSAFQEKKNVHGKTRTPLIIDVSSSGTTAFLMSRQLFAHKIAGDPIEYTFFETPETGFTVKCRE